MSEVRRAASLLAPLHPQRCGRCSWAPTEQRVPADRREREIELTAAPSLTGHPSLIPDLPCFTASRPAAG